MALVSAVSLEGHGAHLLGRRAGKGEQQPAHDDMDHAAASGENLSAAGTAIIRSPIGYRSSPG